MKPIATYEDLINYLERQIAEAKRLQETKGDGFSETEMIHWMKVEIVTDFLRS